MAQLAAQDYFSRLQASGLSQLPFSHELAGMFPQSFVNSGAQGSMSASRGSNDSKSGNKTSKKDKRGSGSGNISGNSSTNNSSGSNSTKGANNSDYKVNLFIEIQRMFNILLFYF